MFGSRKHRQPNPPLATAPVNPNAATAAAAVFRRHESSSPSLSAAAAAAALAARPMTPTRVADVQTKRTIRRSASVASSAASSDARSRPALQRSGSSASMTERTFRSPSPHRPSSSGSGHRQTQSLGYNPPDDMPPVPALPKTVDPASRHQQLGTQQDPPQRRATVMGISNPPVRLASEALASKNAHSWFGAAKVGDMRNVRRTDPAMASPPSSPPRTVRHDQADVGRPSSRSSSINFSYPARARVASPPPGATFDETSLTEPPPVPALQQRQTSVDRQPSQSRQAKSQPKRRVSTAPGAAPSASSEILIYDPNSRRMVRQADLYAAEQAIVQASERHTNTKRKKQTPQRAGSHLAKGTMGRTKVGGSIVLPDEQPRTIPTAPPIKPQPRIQQAHAAEAQIARISSPKPESQSINSQRAPESAVSQNDGSDAADRTAQGFSAAPNLRHPAGQTIKRQPSTVKEESEQDPELEEDYVLDSLDAVPARQRVYTNGVSRPDECLQPSNHPPNIPAAPLSPPPSQEPQFSADPSKPVGVANTDNPKYAGFAPIKNLHIIPPRNHSNSPVRQAHFGPVSDSLAVKHSPPPRSISPRKSALKNSRSPTRGASPSDDTSEASGGVPHHQDPAIHRKKSVRVSFDDSNTVVATEQAGSQSPSSPQGPHERRHWYSSLRPGNKEHSSLGDDEFLMQPRPALPSFGSVRDRKPREAAHDEAERPLVRPMVERSHAPSEQLGQSSDHALAAILTNDSEDKSKVPANTSRFREPLPPVVTSVDGGDFLSESDTSSTADSDDLLASEGTDVHGDESLEAPTEPADEAVPLGSREPVKVQSPSPVREIQEIQVQASSSPSENAIPTIVVAQPTPPATEKKVFAPYLNLPGGFPDDDSSSSASLDAKNVLSRAVEIKEPVTAPLGPLAGQSALLPAAEPSSDSESSIYSDAYEDLSDIEGGTFQSLDAVVESPIGTKPTRDPLHDEAHLQGSPSRQPPPEPRSSLSSTSVAVEQPAPADDEWEKVKAYWRSLTAEKRAQLAKETVEDAGIEGDLEEIMAESKPKKKKSVERRVSERKVLAVHMAQQMMAQQEKQKAAATAPTRSYMIQPGTKWAGDKGAASTMRTTMRSQPPHRESAVASNHDGPRLRTSMRSSEPGAAKSKSSRQPQLSGQGSRAPRTGLEPVAATSPRGATTHTRAASEQISQAAPSSSKVPYNPPKLKRRGSTSSESSFRRSRPVGGGLSTFRQSMRQSSPSAASPTAQPAAHPEKGFKRFSLRSRSPPVSMNNASSQMRQTLRDSSSERKKSSPTGGFRMPSFGLSHGSTSKKVDQRASGSKFASRFGNSSDEDDDGTKSGFRSRFEESSDDEALSPISPPKKSPTIPGHLRHQESLASTALPEELEESEDTPVNVQDVATSDTQKVVAAPGQQPTTAATPATPPAGLAAPTPLGTTAIVKGAERHPPTPSKRGSIMSALRRKKQTGISRPEITESAARRDTKLERPVSQLRRIRTPDAAAASPLADQSDDDETPRPLPRTSPKSPKLQKRVASLRRSMDSANPSVNVTGGGDLPSPLALPGSVVGGKGQDDPSPFFVGGGGKEDQALRSPLRRPSAGMSGNLGTRTLSGFSSVSKATTPGGGGGGVFAPRRTVSSGVVVVDKTQPAAPEVSSLAGTGSTKKKKFGMLRRLLGIHD